MVGLKMTQLKSPNEFQNFYFKRYPLTPARPTKETHTHETFTHK